MDFLQGINYMQLVKAFIVGGIICIIGQILIDKTKLTPARILVVFVTTRSNFAEDLEYINI